jgi:two-component system, OmpR family, phosphate regulon response regulator PhoB
VAAQVRPDLVLLDVMMPGPIDGLEACRQMKANPDHQGMQIILLTARGQSSDREAGQQAGADQYIVKPFSPLNLIETLAECLGRQS